MGTQASSLVDGEPVNKDDVARQLTHFDHTFKVYLIAVGGVPFTIFKNSKRPATLTCKASTLEIFEESGFSNEFSDQLSFNISYAEICQVTWDHAMSAVKLTFKNNESGNAFATIQLPNSIEFEEDIKLRLSGAVAQGKGIRVPTPTYIGMFAGTSKPKPFQRKRPNITRLPSGTLPSLNTMRSSVLDLHRGSYAPCVCNESRRLHLAIQHIHEGHNYIPLTDLRGRQDLSNHWCSDSVLLMNDTMLIFMPHGINTTRREIKFPYSSIVDWKIIDKENIRKNDSGMEISLDDGDSEVIFFKVKHVRDLKHTFEYYWNKFQVEHGRPVRAGSTHGRPIVTLHTLTGKVSVPPAPVGLTEVVDENGVVVEPGQVYLKKKQTRTFSRVVTSAGLSTALTTATTIIRENLYVKAHWNRVVKHQGWLLKKGNIGVGSAKQWLKRYFVLYDTSQGHFLVYYSDVTKCPLYCKEVNHRNVIDLAKSVFIQLGSINENGLPNSFDIITIERKWTLCAETQDDMQRWLKLLSRAVDEDVAILPDEALLFQVKAKTDPTGVLSTKNYSTSVKVSALGVSVSAIDYSGRDVEHFFWVYTDLFKWSLLSQNGKLAVCVNVFTDSGFNRRHDLVFRTKEAVRLVTAIQYFIEKFTTVMHVRLELEDVTPLPTLSPEELKCPSTDPVKIDETAVNTWSMASLKGMFEDRFLNNPNSGFPELMISSISTGLVTVPAVVSSILSSSSTTTAVSPISTTSVTVPAVIASIPSTSTTTTAEESGVANRMLNTDLEKIVSPGNPLFELFRNLPSNIPLRDAMDQVLTAVSSISTASVTVPAVVASMVSTSTTTTAEESGVANRMLSTDLEEIISPGNPLFGLFRNLPSNIPFRDAMDQVLTERIAEADIDVLTLSVELAVECAEEDMRSNPAAASMTLDEVAAIKMYTMTAEPPTTALYYLLNKALREKNRNNLRPFVKILWLLIHALKKAQPYPRPLVYRGVRKDLSGQYHGKGQKVTWQGFTSATSSLDVLHQDLFLGTNGKRTIFNIELSSNRARVISALSMIPGESEVLLPPNSKFVVEAVLGPTADGLFTVHLREIAPIDPILLF